jgi:transcriptional regulator with XRE-family HTH domain
MSTRQHKAISNRLRALRQLAGLSQTQLAQRIKVSQPLISEFERQVLYPGPELRARLAAALGVSADELFGEIQ